MKKERTRTDDLAELVVGATVALAEALNDGDAKHGVGTWKQETSGNHINHLLAHMKRIQAGEWTDERGHDHAVHVVCRAVMMLITAHKS